MINWRWFLFPILSPTLSLGWILGEIWGAFLYGFDAGVHGGENVKRIQVVRTLRASGVTSEKELDRIANAAVEALEDKGK